MVTILLPPEPGDIWAEIQSGVRGGKGSTLANRHGGISKIPPLCTKYCYRIWAGQGCSRMNVALLLNRGFISARWGFVERKAAEVDKLVSLLGYWLWPSLLCIPLHD